MATHSALDADTIAAVATPPGRGGVGIIRLSGPAAQAIAFKLCRADFQPRHAHHYKFYAGEDNSDPNSDAVIDSGLAIYFPAPNSFTGEDVVEIQGHGGPVVMDMLLRRCTQLGARVARAGEFSERAYLNDKMDLTQAEAIADLINSTTESAARSANRSLQGEFAAEINQLLKKVIDLRVYVEAAIDFPEEEIDFLVEGGVLNKLDQIISQLEKVTSAARQGQILSEGIHLVIAGKPNAGKSSILNALSGQDTAIVTAVEGTTRDVLRKEIQIDGIPLHIIDTAGLRDDADEIEKEGIRRAWLEIEAADHVLVVSDAARDREGEEDALVLIEQRLPKVTPITLIHNKCDLSNEEPGLQQLDDRSLIKLSAKTGAGVDLLKQHLKSVAGYSSAEAGQFSARSRHLVALANAEEALLTGRDQLTATGAGELLAEDLRVCQQHLGEITGEFSSDDLLGEIFSSFCIGK
jgi:tRNA modification GTPase